MSGNALLGSWLCVSVTAGVEICGDSICGNNICCCSESAEFAVEPLEKNGGYPSSFIQIECRSCP